MTREAFVNFLRRRYADEQFNFLVAVHELKAMAAAECVDGSEAAKAKEFTVQKTVDDLVLLYIKVRILRVYIVVE